MGKVDRLFATGANDVLVVTVPADVGQIGTQSGAASEILIPWVMGSVIFDVDQRAKKIRVDWEFDY